MRDLDVIRCAVGVVFLQFLLVADRWTVEQDVKVCGMWKNSVFR